MRVKGSSGGAIEYRGPRILAAPSIKEREGQTRGRGRDSKGKGGIKMGIGID